MFNEIKKYIISFHFSCTTNEISYSWIRLIIVIQVSEIIFIDIILTNIQR